MKDHNTECKTKRQNKQIHNFYFLMQSNRININNKYTNTLAFELLIRAVSYMCTYLRTKRCVRCVRGEFINQYHRINLTLT